jgi:hypothetical protein
MESHRTPLGVGGTMGFHRDILLGEFSVTRKTTMYRSTIRLIVTALNDKLQTVCPNERPKASSS